MNELQRQRRAKKKCCQLTDCIVEPRTLEQMQSFPASYEVGIYIDGEQTGTISFVADKTNQSLMEAAAENWEQIAKNLTKDELDDRYSISVDKGLVLSSGRVVIKYTGKTERQCAKELQKAIHA